MATRRQIDTQLSLLTQQLNEKRTLVSTINGILSDTPYGYTEAGEKVFNYDSQRIGFQDLQGDLASIEAEIKQLTDQITELTEQRTQAAAGITADFNDRVGPTKTTILNNYVFQPKVVPTQTVLRDYRHAARIFTDDQFRLSPKYGFLFYVEFVFNPEISAVSNQSKQELGMIVKSCSLPKFSIDTKVHNAYNRKNIVQNKINYDPVNIVFHDDQADNVKNFWYDYYSFFFRDPDYADSTYNSAHKYQSRSSFDWGYTPRPTTNNGIVNQPYQYIQSIKIYSLYQKNFSEYQLINPTITSFKHGDHVNGDNNLLEHQMTVQFETVKYLTGYTTSNTAGGYVDLHYDTTESPLGTWHGGPNKVPNGMGGYADVPETVTDMASSTVLVKGDVGLALTPINTNIGSAFATSFASATSFAAGSAGTNFGGFTIPTLGSLTQGVTNGAILAQQAQATAVNAAGTVANNLANGVIGGLAEGIGQNGGAVINIVAAAIQNPQALVATATNMAAAYAMQEVSGKLVSLAQGGIDELSGWIKTGVGEMSTEITKAFGDLQLGASEFFSGASEYSTQAFENFQASGLDIDNLDAADFGGDLSDV